MSIEDAVGPILATVFLLGMLLEAIWPREPQPKRAELVQHLNIRTPRWLEWIMQRPEAHQRHHEFGQHAGNYADWPVWDKLLGTYSAPAQSPLEYGFTETASRRYGAMLLCLDVNRNEPKIVRHEQGVTAVHSSMSC